jgi:hypothetical protein
MQRRTFLRGSAAILAGPFPSLILARADEVIE